MPRNYIENDIKRLLDHCPGITVHLSTGLGTDVTLAELKEKHDAVLLSIGLWKDRALNVPGEEKGLKGLYGIEFLTDLAAGKAVALKGKAVVIGGGNVAMDVSRAALRAGPDSVHLYCLESRAEMPAWKHEIEEAEKEDIVINNSWGPKQILHENGRVTGVEFKRCVSVFDSDGRFRPVYDEDNTVIVDADAVLLSIGLQSVNDELEGLSMMTHGYVKAKFASMRTEDPKVFAAGDGAFGPSSIVQAMASGHRAAYYLQAFLDGREDPMPYQPTYRTRAIPVAQDPMWEKLQREEQVFHCFSKDQPGAPECEDTYDQETCRHQAARCLRCDAETGHSDYTRRTRDFIHTMAHSKPEEIEKIRNVTIEMLQPRDNPFPESRPAHIDDVVFLSAALTRLVIDPYREHCDTSTRIGDTIQLEQPFLLTGFDDAPEEVRRALADGLAAKGCGYIGARPLVETHAADKAIPWFQLVMPDSTPSKDADGLIYVQGKAFQPIKAKRLHDDQKLGLSVSAPALEQAIPWALDNNFDILLLDGSTGIEKPWSELDGHPDLTVMRDAIRIIRHQLNREEDISLVYFGGLRSGTDVAKALAVNCQATVFGVAMAIALGGEIDGDCIRFNGGRTVEERKEAAENWIKATADETAIIARCTGKTKVHNLEPEDMRSITLVTSEALDIPMASGTQVRDGF